MIRDPAEIQKSNVWEDAGRHKGSQSKAGIIEKTMIVLGSPSCGKTSFIRVFESELDFETKPTHLIDYSYIKKMAIKKEVIHCYEIANKTLTDILGSLINVQNYQNLIFVLCVDLSRPAALISETMQWLHIIDTEMRKFIATEPEVIMGLFQGYEGFRKSKAEEYGQNEDKDLIEPLPLSTIIVGTKYDLFQKYETENRKWVARALRYLAHQSYAGLYFCSTRNMQVGAQLRAYLQEKIQNEKNKKIGVQTDHLKPIFIHSGEDVIRAMNLPNSGSMSPVQVLEKQLQSLFGAEDGKNRQPVDLSRYGESRIDSIINDKKKGLQRIAKMLQNSENRSNKQF